MELQTPATLHIICLDDPSQPVYGGVIDMHYRIRALANAGVRLHLHIFYKGKSPDLSVLRQWADVVYTYPRKSPWLCFWRNEPFIVSSREHPDLYQRLAQDNHPVLFEGIHTTATVPALRKMYPERKLFLRAHNIESHYYNELYHATSDWIRRIYFRREFLKIRTWEHATLPLFTSVWSISTEETERLKSLNPSSLWIPAFIHFRNQRIHMLPALDAEKCTLLFHGNFSVDENRISAEWLLNFFRNKSPESMELILAGKNLKACSFEPHAYVRQVSDPEFMEDLLTEADIVVLPGKQRSGVKIKLLESLAAAKRVICSPEIASGSGLEQDLICFENEEELSRLLLLCREGKLEQQFLNSIQAFRRIYEPGKITGQILEMI